MARGLVLAARNAVARASGNPVVAPDLPGMGEDGTALSGITLDLWARFVANLVKQQPEPVVLVGP
jgi:pimeloyl-ACP methyl ester carboxylesterase